MIGGCRTAWLTLQIGDTAYDQMVFPAYSALGGECDNMIVVLKLIPNWLKGGGRGPDRKHQELALAEALATFSSVDNVRAFAR